MKNITVLMLLVLLATGAFQPAARADEFPLDRPRFLDDLHQATVAGLGVYATADVVEGVAACGTDTIALAVTALFDTVPLTGLATGLVQDLIRPQLGQDLDQVSKRRGIGDNAGLMVPLFLGAPVGILVTGVFESLSNGAKLAMYRHPNEVDYSSTGYVAKCSYLFTELQFMESFKDRNSYCRRSLWKLYQIGHEMSARRHESKTAGTPESPQIASDALRPVKKTPTTATATAEPAADRAAPMRQTVLR